MPVLATYTFGQALLTVLEFALLFLWIWVAIGVIADIFRSHDLSGWAKAAWLILIVVIPLVGVLIYLIARGHRMSEHAVTDAQAQDVPVIVLISSRSRSDFGESFEWPPGCTFLPKHELTASRLSDALSGR